MRPSRAVIKTQFYNVHMEAGGKLALFAGYLMPIQYQEGIINEHLHVRKNVGLFDVSHMGQIIIRGARASTQLEKIIPLDLESLKINQQAYTTLTSVNGGIIDDLIITRWSNSSFYLVVNAANKNQDLSHIKQQLPELEITCLENQSLVALQGNRAVEIMEQISLEASALKFMHGCSAEIEGIQCYVTRSGYTGEDGFEISVADEHAITLSNILLDSEYCKWIGLGARDSLRLEAGLCLHGNDVDSKISPVEAGLAWSISSSRRSGGAKQGGFLGSQIILDQLTGGVKRKRVGFLVDGKAPVRGGTEIINSDGDVIGVITSGGFSPTLKTPIAMGYVRAEFSNLGMQLSALVRGKSRLLTITEMPFVRHRYCRG